MNSSQIIKMLAEYGFKFERQAKGCHKIFKHNNGETVVWSHSTGRRSSPASLRNLKAEIKRKSKKISDTQICA